MLTDLADVLRAAGLEVIELPGWKTRSRPASTGGFDPRGNLWHHTGGAANDRDYAEWMATVGRSDLPAPLCQVAIDRQGRCYVSAAGRANHGGTARATGPMPAGDANFLYIGWECMNTGSEGWSPAQYGAMVTAAAATSTNYGWPATHNRAHRETSVTGKWDPGLLDMDKFRNDIDTAMTAPKGFTVDKEAANRFDKLEAAVSDVRTAVSDLRKKEAERFAKSIREQRKAGRDLDDILAELEAEGDDSLRR